MRISFNASAVLANNSLTRTDNKLADSLARLSSGLKVVNAKDNPSGLAMGKRMNAQIEGISVATQNSNDGISIVEIADGTMSEIHDMLQRMNELAIKAANGTMLDEDRKLVDDEIQQLKEEITRISNDTQFNGQTILDGSFDLKGYTDNQDVKVTYYSDEVIPGQYSLDGVEIKYDEKGNIDWKTASESFDPANAGGFPADAKVTQTDGNIITIAGGQDFEIKLEVRSEMTISNLSMDLVGFSAMDMQIGANEGQQLAIRIPKVSLENMGISSLNTLTQDNAGEAIEAIDGAIKYISASRSRLGAYQNRLEHTVSTLDITTENMTAAYSRIMDVDMAAEMTEYTTLQVMSQASTSMLAQANERPSQVLQLLQ